MTLRLKQFGFLFLLSGALACGSGGGGGGGGGGSGSGAESANFGCDGNCAHQSLSAADVTLILQQAVSAASARGVNATVAVVDRVGNVLGVYQMPGATGTTRIDGQIGAAGGLEQANVPATLAAISKAGTGAFLSSQGNAFSTRTASQIIQENFNPGERMQPAGPLFGVQFSQLPCSDVPTVNPAMLQGVSASGKTNAGGTIGPRALPLGLSADPGGIPLYKQGDVVGGIGVEIDGVYRVDRNISDHDDDIEERIAMQGSRSFEIPSELTGKVFAGGKSLRTIDLSYGALEALPATLSTLSPASIVHVAGFFNGVIRGGATLGDGGSGVMNTTRAGRPAAVLVNGATRFPTRGGSGISGGEVDAILDSALLTALRTRAQIRRPLDTPAQVSIWVVDAVGNALGMVRTQDAPVFGIDVALQKARTAAFFSSPQAGALLARAQAGSGEDYVGRVRSFLGGSALTGANAISDRAIGNLARPFYPDGINGSAPGPFSLPHPDTGLNTGSGRSWSPFDTGLQLDVVFSRLLAPLSGSFPNGCTDGSLGARLKNGTQIFPGSVPLYRGTTLIGAIGISGDGVDQDDLIAFYGASRAGLDFAGHSGVGDPTLGFNAPPEIRADTLETPVGTTRLRYVNCPESPFVDSNEQGVCD